MNTTTHPGSRGATILLHSGRYFDFNEPAALTEQEVAHALSHICRFTGHSSSFYSVAQHSVLVSFLVPQQFALWGLMHDSAEAVMGDMASPLKALMPEYKALEKRCEDVIFAGFGLQGDMPPEVKHADRVALRTEQRDLMHREGGLWTSLEGVEPAAHIKVKPWEPDEARLRFLLRYRHLRGHPAQDDRFLMVA